MNHSQCIRRVLDVGNCSADHAAIRRLLTQHFPVAVDQAHDVAGALEKLEHQPYALVTVNRVLDRDGSSGLELIGILRQHAKFRDTPVMLISNIEQYQQQAQAAGARPGFGKAHLHASATRACLAPWLGAEMDAPTSGAE